MSHYLALLIALTVLFGCSTSASSAAVPEGPTRSLGLAFKSGPCVAGANVVPAFVFVADRGRLVRYLEPTDGEFRFALVVGDRLGAPITLRWLDVPEARAQTPSPAGPPWNLELAFDSPTAGACPIRVEFRPSLTAERAGLGMAETTVVLDEAPPPPPNAGK